MFWRRGCCCIFWRKGRDDSDDPTQKKEHTNLMLQNAQRSFDPQNPLDFTFFQNLLIFLLRNVASKTVSKSFLMLMHLAWRARCGLQAVALGEICCVAAMWQHEACEFTMIRPRGRSIVQVPKNDLISWNSGMRRWACFDAA